MLKNLNVLKIMENTLNMAKTLENTEENKRVIRTAGNVIKHEKLEILREAMAIKLLKDGLTPEVLMLSQEADVLVVEQQKRLVC